MRPQNTNAQMLARLEAKVDRLGTSLRPQLIAGTEAGMRKLARHLKSEGKPVTILSLTEESLSNARFVAAYHKVDILPSDIKGMAMKIIIDMKIPRDPTSSPSILTRLHNKLRRPKRTIKSPNNEGLRTKSDIREVVEKQPPRRPK